MAPRHARACVRREILLLHLEIEQRARIHAVVEGGDVGDKLHVHDGAAFGGVGVAENLKGEGCLGDLRHIGRERLVGRGICGAVCGGAAGREGDWCGGDCGGLAGLGDGDGWGAGFCDGDGCVVGLAGCAGG